MCALSYLSCGRFLCALRWGVRMCGGSCLIGLAWSGSCVCWLALVDVMAIKLVVSFSRGWGGEWRVESVEQSSRGYAGDVLINSLRAFAA